MQIKPTQKICFTSYLSLNLNWLLLLRKHAIVLRTTFKQLFFFKPWLLGLGYKTKLFGIKNTVLLIRCVHKIFLTATCAREFTHVGHSALHVGVHRLQVFTALQTRVLTETDLI